MKYIRVPFNLIEGCFAVLGLNIVLVLSVALISGEITLVMNGKCHGKCLTNQAELKSKNLTLQQ